MDGQRSMTAVQVRTEWPLYPPTGWFDEIPDWFTPGDKLTVQTDGHDAGRVAGTVAPRGQCLLDGGTECWSAPFSPTGYAAAHQGDTLTAEGSIIHTANIGGGVNHARMSANFRGAVEHYQHTASQLMRVRYHDLDSHIVALGALWPDVTEHDLAVVRASALSGDWRWRPELNSTDMTGACLVNTPGFPLMTRRVAALGEIVVGGAGDFDPDLPTAEERIADLEQTVAALVEIAGLGPVSAALHQLGLIPEG